MQCPPSYRRDLAAGRDFRLGSVLLERKAKDAQAPVTAVPQALPQVTHRAA